MKKYLFRKKSLIVLMTLIDTLGWFLSRLVGIFHNRSKIPAEPKRILVIRLDHIGDVVLTTVIFRAIRSKYKSAFISACVSTKTKDIISNNNFIDEIITYDAPWFFKSNKSLSCDVMELIKFIVMLRKKNFDIAIISRPDARDIFVTWVSGVKYRIGYALTGLGFLLSNVVEYGDGVSEIDVVKNSATPLGLEFKNTKPEIFVSEENKRKACEIFSNFGIDDKSKIVCIHPHAGTQAKRWPIENFVKLTKLLLDNFGDVYIVIVGGSDAVFSAKSIISSLNSSKIVDFTAKIDLSMTAAVLQRATLFVTNDSGPAHIAGALGVRTIVLASGTNVASEWFSCYSMDVVQSSVDCSMCGKRICIDNKCMKQITVDEVYDKVKGYIL